MVRLRVPFAEKEEVKRLGARWNPSGKFWYYPGEELPEALSPWALQKAPGPSAEGGTGQLALAGLSELEAAEPFVAALTVSQLNERIRSSLRNDPFFTKIRVRGEVTNLNEKLAQDGSAHLYFSIKDSGAILNVVVWKTDVKSALAAPLKNGQMTAILGSVDFFAPQGKIQLRAELIRELGVGEAELALLMRKEKLEKEGLFREEFKKKIPVHPKSIGIVTSRNGQAIQDIQKVARKRNPYIQLYLYHVSVQGPQAVASIIEGIQYLDRFGVDTIIVGRGGGSEEELSLYNDESLVRTVFEARTPIVSAVGHAGNLTLIDLVADRRVATPTEAAEECVPDIMTVLLRLRSLRRETGSRFATVLMKKQREWERQKAILESFHPGRRLEEKKIRGNTIKESLDRNMREILQRFFLRRDHLAREIPERMQKVLNRKQHRFEVATARLHGLSPTAKLVHGFGYISLSGEPLRSVTQARTGDSIRIRIHDGSLDATIEKIRRDIEKDEG